MDPTEPRTAVKSADRVLDLFELLARWARPLSHTELADHLGIPKSSLTQLLQTLVARGYLAFAPGTRNYQLGPSLMALARQQSATRDLVALAKPILEDLTGVCRESSALNVLRGNESVVVATVLGPQRLVSHMREGDAAPLYATSGGKALLAFMPAGMQDEYLAQVRFQRFLPATLNSVTDVRKEIAAVRERGVAFVREEFTEGISGVAVPIRHPGSFVDAPPLASLNVALPTVRFSASVRDAIVAELERARARMEELLFADARP